MPTKELTLPPDLIAKLDERVASGAAASAVDVVRDGLAALELEDARKLDALRAKIARSMNDPRPSIPADQVFDNIEKLLASLKR